MHADGCGDTDLSNIYKSKSVSIVKICIPAGSVFGHVAEVYRMGKTSRRTSTPGYKGLDICVATLSSVQTRQDKDNKKMAEFRR